MKTYIGTLTFTLFACCFAAQDNFDKYYRNTHSDVKAITISFVLAGFGSENLLLSSELGQWLQGASETAQEELTKDLGVTIELEIANVLEAPRTLLNEIKSRTILRQMHGPTILYYIKTIYKNALKPDILCVITKDKFYDTNLSNGLGFSLYTTLCEDMVPMLLTYDWDTQDDTPAAGKLLYKLVRQSINENKWKSTPSKATFFDGCNIRHRPKGEQDNNPDTYYVLPFDEDQYYSY
uniref:Putative ixodes 26 kDa salivary protein n=1 Tax=Ixodes ricinus TaxID=34613 RepID=A0A0K8RLB0_IXORI